MKSCTVWLPISKRAMTQSTLRGLLESATPRLRNIITGFSSCARVKNILAGSRFCTLVLASVVSTGAVLNAQSVQATCSHVWIDSAHFATSGDQCIIRISPAPAARLSMFQKAVRSVKRAVGVNVASPGSGVVVYDVSGTLDIWGHVVPYQRTLDFHGEESTSYSGPTVGSIKYNGTTIYTRPLP